MPRPNKQKATHAASFRRIAKELRIQAKLSRERFEPSLVSTLLKRIATTRDIEARTLRAMR